MESQIQQTTILEISCLQTGYEKTNEKKAKQKICICMQI